jgi:hypothetical protein
MGALTKEEHMAHSCVTTYWGRASNTLNGKLDLGNLNGGGTGWATGLASVDEYNALVTLKDRLIAARGYTAGPPIEYVGGTLVVNGLYAATTDMMAKIESDRWSTTAGHHTPTAPSWNTTGSPEGTAAARMADTWTRIKGALGS